MAWKSALPTAAVVMCHQSNSTGAALASDGAAAEGPAADAAVDGAATDGAAADGALVAPVPVEQAVTTSAVVARTRTCASALTRLDLLLCSPPEDSILRATGAPPTSGAAKVSVWSYIGFDANPNRPFDGRQARRSGAHVPKVSGAKRAKDTTIERRFRRYGEYAGLAFWLYLTRDWVAE